MNWDDVATKPANSASWDAVAEPVGGSSSAVLDVIKSAGTAVANDWTAGRAAIRKRERGESLARGNEASARMLEADQASGTAAEMQRMADQRAASEAAKSGTFNSAVDAVRDTGVNLARGVADIGQAATGLVAMPLDAVGALEPLKKVGVDFRGASKGLDDFDKWAAGYLSDTGKDKEAKLEAAKGFTDTLMTLGTDPRLMYQEIIKSLPGTFGAGKVGEAAVGVYGSRFAAEAKAAGLTGEVAQRYIAKAFADNADKITKAAMIGSAAGEGTQQAGGLAGKAQKDSIAFKDYAGPAVASGVLDAAISLGSSKLANKIGIGDIETDIALRKTGVSSGKTAPAFWLNRGAIEGFKEGAFEELPQSTQEAIAENLAYGRPWDQGLGKAAAQGLATGFGMGGGHAIVSHQSDNQSSGAEPIQPAAPADTSPVNAADVLGTAPDATTSFSDTEIQSITDNASRRIAAIERKAKGTPDQNMPGPDGKPMVVHGEPAQFLTDNEKAELDFLKKNMGNPQAIADAYGIKPASAKPAETPAQALAPSAASLTEGPRPDVPMIKGKVDTVKTDSGVPLRYQWALVPIDEEIRSHTSSLNVNPVYPAEFQPRDRTRTASATQASEMQQRYDPTRAGWSPDIQNGAPIISPDGVMLSGNMRGLVQDRILSAGGDKAEELRNHIAETAEQYGFTPEQVKQAFAENPRMALRRVLVDPINRSEFARQANASTVAQMSPSEQASTDAARITHMDDLNPTEAGDFAASRDFVKRFVGALPITEQAGMMDKDGQLSQAGYARIRNAILAKAYGNSPALLRMTESMDDSLRNISKALMQVAPAVAKSRDGIAQGALHPVEITDVLLPAVESLNRLRESGVSVAEHVAQQGMFGNARPEVADMLRFLDENIRRPRKVADFLNAYLAALDAAGNPGQGTLLGGSTVPTQADLMAAARRSTNDEQFAATAEAPRLSRSERRGGSPGADTESQSQSGDTQGNRRGAGEGAQPAVDLSTSQGEHHGKEGQGEGRRQEGLLNASGGEVSPGLAKEESAVYAVNEPDKFTGDLFNHEIPEADGDNMDRARKAATGSPDSQAAAVTAVRGDPENPGVFTVTTNLVTVGERKLPLNRVRTVEDAATVFAYLAKSAVEHYDALVTDKNGKPLAIIGSFKGELTSASVYPGVVAQELARIDGAATLWGAHNHPSGIAELSRADEVLSDTFAKLMRGSGVEYAGLFAMSGTASGKTQYSFYTQGGTTETGATDNTLPAKYNVPIVERELIDSGARLGSVNTPNQAKALVAEIAKDSPGILFMDAQHRAVSFVPFEPKAMGRLRTDGRLMKLFESVSKNNAGAAVIAMPDGKVTRKQFLNLQGALKSMEIRVLDGVEYDSASKVPGLSMAERGLDAGGPGIAFFSRTKTSASPDESLIIQHNLSADKLLHAFRMGGLPVPSLAITDKYMPIEGFGDITLLGSRNMADPKGYASTKAFGADIYSPRYPTVKYVTTPAMRKRAEAILKDGLEATNSRVAWDEIKDKGASELSYTAALRWKFLKERGIEPAIVRAEAKPLPKELQPFAKTDSNPFELEQDLAFIDAVYAVHERELVRAYGGDVRAAKDEIAQSRANADKRGVSYLVRESARQVNQYRMDAAANGAIDRVATNLAMEKQIYDAGLRDDLERYAAEFLRDINPDEKIFKGFTYSGNPRYAPHTLDNVVKELRKELRGGEGFNYGVGSVRSAFTPQFRTIDQIRKAKDRLLGKAEFEKVKSEIDSEFSAVSDTLAPYHSHSNEFGFGEIVSSMMYDSAKMGVPRALKENAFDDVPVEAQQNVVRFLNKLRTLPTQYFEAKILRAVDFGEFAGAVVPEGVDPKVIDALTSRGVTDIRTYKNGDEGSRAKAVTALAEELHQAGKGTLFSRGTALDGGISTENVEREAKKLLAGLSNPPKLSVAWSPKDLPFDAPSDTRGVFFKGTMYLVAGGITSAENLREVVAHEMIGHYGMRGFFGAALDAVLSRIHNINPLVQKNAKAWIENNQDLIAEYRKEGMTEAQIKSISIEEGMAKIAEAGKVLTGARLLTVALQRLLRAVGLRNMANTLESNTDAEALLALKKAEMFAKRGWTKDNYIKEAIYPAFVAVAPVFSRATTASAPAVRHSRTANERADAIINSKVAVFAPIDKTLQVVSNITGATKLASWTGGKIGQLLDRLTPETVKAGMVADYGIPEAVIDRRAQLAGAQREQVRKTGELIDKLMTLTRAESRVAYLWMNSADPQSAEYFRDQLPPDSIKTLAEVEKMIDSLSAEAVRLGQMSAETRERNRFAYLHRSYAKHMEELTKGEKSARQRAIAVLGNQYKGRGMTDERGMSSIKNIAPEWWKRKTQNGKADTALKGEKFIRLERRQAIGQGVASIPGIAAGGPKAKLLEVHYWPAGEALPAKYGAWDQAGTWEARDTKGDKLILWRDFTAQEREAMGEIDEVRYAIAKTLHGMIHDVEVGKYLEWIAVKHAAKDKSNVAGPIVEASESMRDAFKPGTFVQVPETRAFSGGPLKYGLLAGRYLPGPIWNDVRQTAGMRFKPLGETYSKILTAWKKNKTALSPGVHMNNVMSNFVMADWHDVSSGHVFKALRILLAASTGDGKGALGRIGNVAGRAIGSNDVEAAKAILARFEDSGGSIGTWATKELRADQLAPLVESLEKELGLAGNITGDAGVYAALQQALHLKFPAAWEALTRSKPGKLSVQEARNMIALYESEDQVFRLGAWLKAKEAGATDTEAGKFGRESFLDYHINAPWVQGMRQTMFPFISFTYRALPMLAHTAKTKPWKLAKLALIAGALNAIGYALSGGDEDKERALLPEEKAGRVWGMVPKLMRMPWNDSHNSPVFLDVRRWIPVGDVFDVGQAHSVVPVLPFMMPGGPLEMLFEAALNKSGFTGQPIVEGTDTLGEASLKTMDWLYKAFMPNIALLPNTYAWQGISDAASGKTDAFGRQMSLTQSAANTIGVKLGAYPGDVLRLNATRATQAKMQEIDHNITLLSRQFAQHGITKEQFDSKVAAEIAKKQGIVQDLQKRAAGR